MSHVETGYFGVNVTPASGATVALGSQTAGIGTISNSGAGTGDINGTATKFLSQFRVGSTITVGLETQQVIEVTTDTDMVTTPFAAALSGASFTLAASSPLRWQMLDSGTLVGPDTGTTAAPQCALVTAPFTEIDNDDEIVITTLANFSPSMEFTGTGTSNTNGVLSEVTVSRTTSAPDGVSGAAVYGLFSISGNNTQNWPAGIPNFSPTAVRGTVFAGADAAGTIARLAGVTANVDTLGADDLDVTKMFGFALIKAQAEGTLTNGVGAGLYNVGGTNRAYIVLSPTVYAVPSGNWAIYDDTGYDTRLSGALKVGAGSDLVIDSDAILHQYGVALPKNNNTASAAPTANDDSTADYSVGSVWFWPATGRIWKLRDATASAAQWVEIALADAQGYISGNWYMAPDIAVAAGVAPATGAIQLVPLVIKSRVTLSTLGVRIVTSENGGNLQLALYANNPATGRPTGNAVATTASISTSSTGVVSASIAGGNVTLEPGLYWAAYNVDSTASNNVAIQVASPENHPTASLIGATSQANLGASATDDLISLHVAQTYGTWPNLTSATFVEGSTPSRNGPAMHFRVA